MGQGVKTFVLTRSPAVLLRQPGYGGRAGRDIDILPLDDLRRALRGLPEGALVYIDVRGMEEREIARLASTIKASPSLRFGVIDSAGAIDDVAALFHAGAVDYLGKKTLGIGLTQKRVAAVLKFAMERAGGDSDDEREPAQPAYAENGWADVVPGSEHRFAFLFIEVDDAEEMKKRYEPGNLATAMETFRAFIERTALPHGGRLWMWTRFGGLVLFPLRGEGCPAALCGMRILLSRIFYDVEESLLPGRISFRMALAHGTTVYHESETGRLVSDAINSIYHLGRRFTPAGHFLLTAEACAAAPPALRAFCQPVGTFEGRRIMRMSEPAAGRQGEE
jgi:hypothetical protein